jgi:cold-inducible RNA-binding protein
MKNIYIANLSFGTTEQTVRSLFEAYGTVDRVSIVTDRETGQPRGFGFVEMPNDAEAEKAIAGVNGKDVGGRTLAVNEARPKSDRPTGGGRRPGGRDRFNREAPKPFPNRQVLT